MRVGAIRDADERLIEEMLAPLPLEQARSSLEFWCERRNTLAFYRRAERREADEMIRRWRVRVEDAERARFGSGLLGLARKVLAHDSLSWPWRRRRGFFAFAWSILPRRVALALLAALVAFCGAAVGIGLGLTMLVLHMT